MCLVAAGGMRDLASEASPEEGLSSFVSEWCSELSPSCLAHDGEALAATMERLDRCWGFLCPRDVPQPDMLPGMERGKEKIHN